MTLTRPLAFVLVALLSTGCANLWNSYRSAFAFDSTPEQDQKIDDLSEGITKAIAADDLEGGIKLSKDLWLISFAGSCNSCAGRAYPALQSLREAVLAAAKARPAFEAAMLLKFASENQYWADGVTGRPAEELEGFRKELVAELATVEGNAKPELLARADALQKAGRTASASLVLAQLVDMYPTDKDAVARRDEMRKKVKEQNLFRFTAKGHKDLAPALLKASFASSFAIAADQKSPFAEVELKVGEPVSSTDTRTEKRSASVKTGTKTVENTWYKSTLRDIEREEKNVADGEAAIRRMMQSKKPDHGNIATKRSDIDRRQRNLEKLRKTLSKTPRTTEEAVYTDMPYEATVRSVTVKRDVNVVVRAGGRELAQASDVASSARSAVTHKGLAAAGISPVAEPLPSTGDVDTGTLADALSKASMTLAAAYRTHLAETTKALAAKGGDDATEAAALALVLNPQELSNEDVATVKKALRLNDPAKLVKGN